MTPAETELLRIALLQLLRTVDYSQSLPLLVLSAKRLYREANERIVRAEMDYLVDKGLAALDAKIVSPENRRWRITAAGRDFLAEEGA